MTASISSGQPALDPPDSSPAAERAELPEPSELPIVFFDGECVMCNRFLDLMMAIDQPMTLKVAPLQGQTARQCLPPLATDPEDWSIYLLDDTGLYSQSDAVIRIAQQLGGIWSMAAAASIIPQRVRDGLYRAIAQNRYRMLGKRTCRLPSEAEESRFLP